jgi:hypothetical protein
VAASSEAPVSFQTVSTPIRPRASRDI